MSIGAKVSNCVRVSVNGLLMAFVSVSTGCHRRPFCEYPDEEMSRIRYLYTSVFHTVGDFEGLVLRFCRGQRLEWRLEDCESGDSGVAGYTLKGEVVVILEERPGDRLPLRVRTASVVRPEASPYLLELHLQKGVDVKRDLRYPLAAGGGCFVCPGDIKAHETCFRK